MMRESQMKKIIAVAVATAFAVPAFAAEVTVTGDVEYIYSAKAGTTGGSIGDKDFQIGFSDEKDGISVSGYLLFEDAANTTYGDSEPVTGITISGSFGAISVGDDIGSAVGSFDEIADKAEKGADINDAGGTLTNKTVGVKYALPAMVDGLTVHVGMEVGNTTTEESSTSFALQYSMGSTTVFFGNDDGDDGDAVNAYGVSYTTGPFYAAYEQIDGLDGTAADEMTEWALTYNYGPGTIAYQSGEQTVSGTRTEKNSVSISYGIGPVNTYVASGDTGSSSDATTYVGVEYAF
jgi:hypothetical protein